MTTALHADLDATTRTARTATARADADAPGAGGRLTERERVVLALLGEKEGLTLRQIGAELYVTRNTLKSQVRSIYRKLGVRSRAEAVERARLDGLAVPSPRRGPTGAPVRRG
jgi:LuxR family transcriptional regulator of spore coat protein